MPERPERKTGRSRKDRPVVLQGAGCVPLPRPYPFFRANSSMKSANAFAPATGMAL